MFAQLIGGSTRILFSVFEVPSLATESANSFPQCPTWAFTHLIVISHLSLAWLSAKIQLETVLDLILRASRAEMAALESTKIVAFVMCNFSM